MQIKRSIEKIPGDDARPAIPWRTVPHLLAGGGEIFWIIHQRDDYRYGAHSGGVVFFAWGSIKLSATGTVLRKSGTLVVTKIAVAWVVAAIASRIIPEHGVEVGFFAGLSTLALGGGDGYDQWRTLRFHHAAVRHKRRSWGICVDVVGVRAAHDDDYSGHCRDCLV